MRQTDKLTALVTRTLNTLKDFQRATVERVDTLYRAGQNRVLVADEVGLGKTLIARGVIAKMAQLRQEEGDDLFRVVYICSNQNIARQNITKLDITGRAYKKEDGGLRLSMQHLSIAKAALRMQREQDFIQLLYMTPGTSLSFTGASTGIMAERALLVAILRRTAMFSSLYSELVTMLQREAASGWQPMVDRYEVEVAQLDSASLAQGLYRRYGHVISYSEHLIGKLVENPRYQRAAENLLELMENPQKIVSATERRTAERAAINELRAACAEVSIAELEPDLVVMDEFQRFKDLLATQNEEDENELNLLIGKFLDNPSLRVLLLSATPYKLYSTPEEIEAAQEGEEHFAEFQTVTNFLFGERETDFSAAWEPYQRAMHELSLPAKAQALAPADILPLKECAEAALYRGICRTERLAAGGVASDNITDSSAHTPLMVTEGDILAAAALTRLLRLAGLEQRTPLDFVESAPYLMSFLDGYKLKESIVGGLAADANRVAALASLPQKEYLWLNKRTINNYQQLIPMNAKFELLVAKALAGNAARYLWVPPALPYYELAGAYAGSEGYSKILVFSGWKMVPRMLAALVSYEAERRTIGAWAEQRRAERRRAEQFGSDEDVRYFALDDSDSGTKRRRAIVPRLRFSGADEGLRLNLFTLVYPCKFLARLFSPIEVLNRKLTLAQIEQELTTKIRAALARFSSNVPGGRVDSRWYHMAPLWLDDAGHVTAWLAGEAERDGAGYQRHIAALERAFRALRPENMGRMPDDLAEVLALMALGSPAICAYRALTLLAHNGDNSASEPVAVNADAMPDGAQTYVTIAKAATDVAQTLRRDYNAPEIIAAIDLTYGRQRTVPYWKNVLRYGRDGCLQSMLDEYSALIAENIHSIAPAKIAQALATTLRLNPPTHIYVDDLAHLRAEALGEEPQDIIMRASFARPMFEDSNDAKSTNAKESARVSFNSPVRPFVLASTSIGQEGLDFHAYARRIMHWNLPANPIDLEQREGRINRYKCHAIRQSVAAEAREITFKNDIWGELFAAARERTEHEDAGRCELVPFWCASGAKIERIVPIYPYSRDAARYERLLKILARYRLTLGQPRQEELLAGLSARGLADSDLRELFINLSPIMK